MSDPERRPHNSAATLDTTTIPLMVDAEALAEKLRPHGVELIHPGDCPPGQHPVVIDLWNVRGGRAEIGGVDQHRLSEAAAATAAAWMGASVGAAAGAGLGALGGASAGAAVGLWAGPLGWWWGVTSGFMAGSTLGGALGAVGGGERAAQLGATAGRDWSEASARSVGTYHEALAAVPHVMRRGRGDRPYTFVLGMWTDNPVAIWGDQVLRCGYRKRPAIIGGTHAKYMVRGQPSQATLFSARMRPQSGAIAAGQRCPHWFSQPLLGPLDDGRLAVTFLDRFVDAPGVHLTSVQASLELSPEVCSGLLGGSHQVSPLLPEHPWGAFQIRGLPAKVTYAEHR